MSLKLSTNDVISDDVVLLRAVVENLAKYTEIPKDLVLYQLIKGKLVLPKPYTQAEIGYILGISKERVRQVEQNTTKQLTILMNVLKDTEGYGGIFDEI